MIRFFVFFQLIAFASASTAYTSFGKTASSDSAGFEEARKRHGYEDSAKFAHGNSGSWDRLKSGALAAVESAKQSSRGDHDSGAHHREFGSRFNEKTSGHGHDMRTKTFGFFNYKYVKPQYHIEEFHSDERHSNKYADNSHSSRGRNSLHGGYHDRGHSSYDNEHNAFGNRRSFFESAEDERGYKDRRYDRGYGHDSVGSFGRGYKGRAKNFESSLLSPSYPSSHYSHPVYHARYFH